MMPVVERYTFGLDERVAFRMAPCLAAAVREWESDRHFADVDARDFISTTPPDRPAAAPIPRWLTRYVERGFDLVFWPRSSDPQDTWKGPSGKDAKGWKVKTYTPADYREGMQVGVKLGTEVAPGRYLWDADFDWAEGIRHAARFLPDTRFGFGRASRRLGHLFFTSSTPVISEEYKDVDRTMLVERRGLKKDGTVGRQTMLPPSMHRESGEVVTLALDGAIAHDDGAVGGLTLYAVACLLGRHWPKNGPTTNQHDLASYVAGFLVRRKVDPDIIPVIVEVAAVIGGDDNVPDRVRYATDTVKKFQAGDTRISGGPKLAKEIGQDVVALLDEWLGHAGGPQLIITKAVDVPDERLEKQFGGRLVRGSFSLFAGPGDVGKGMLMVYTAARFTTGDPFPGETHRRDPVKVLLCVTEDSKGRVKSRLRAAGADLDLAFFIEGPEVTRGGLTMASPMMLDDDAGKVVACARQMGAEAIFIETIVEHFGDREGKASRRSTNNEADVRSALAPFREVCRAADLYGFTVIHPRKSTEGSISDSVSGSAAFRNVTRVLHHVYLDPKGKSADPVGLFFTSKSNYLSRRPATLRFRIRSWDEDLASPCMCPIDSCGHEGRLVWEDDLVDRRLAEEIWQQIAERNKPRRDVNVQEAEAFLTGLMENGVIALTPKEILKRANDECITAAAVKRAKENLRLVSKKEGYPAVVVGWQVEKAEAGGL